MEGPGVVLILAAGADWEAAVLATIDARRDLALLRRCVDVDELLAAAAAGQADAAVVSTDAPGLDHRVVEQLQRHGVRAVGVLPAGPGEEQARARAGAAGIRRLVVHDSLSALPAMLLDDDAPPPARQLSPSVALAAVPGPPEAIAPGRVRAVWGPAGAPGRSTVAGAVAAELARRARPTLLVDADPYGGAIAQQLGILDEVSGLLAAARLTSSGALAAELAGAVRMLGTHLGVISGLPRPERWPEVRAEVLDELASVAARTGDVVIDTGFSLEDDGLDPRPGRNQVTLAAVELADEVLVVGTADPVGLTRLARGLVDLGERVPGQAVRIVVNRMRPTLGWSERDIAAMLTGVLGREVAIHFLPEDRATVDKALVSGRTLLESGPDGALPRAVQTLVDALEVTRPVEARPRRAGRARRR